MAPAIAGKLEIKFMNSIIFRLIVLLSGIALILFYGMLMVSAVINLPASWFGFFYCLVGIISGILCFVYFFKKNKLLLVIIAPAIILMTISIINMNIGR